MKILNLTLTKKWFDMIASGEKTEEYREIKQYWINRLCWHEYHNWQPEEIIKRQSVNQICKTSYYDIIRFKNGYAKDAPTMDVECKGIYVNRGVSQWGAEGINVYFVIELGEILSISNYKN